MFGIQAWRWRAAAVAFAILLSAASVASAQLSQQGSKLTPSGPVGSFLLFGQAVAVSADGNTAIVGSPEEGTGAGGARVFVRENGSWSQQGLRLFPNDGVNQVGAGPSFGNALALSADGNIAFIAGKRDNVSQGAVWVFTRTNGVWTQLGTKLTPNDGVAFQQFGASLAISPSGDTLLVGSDGGSVVNAAWIFTRSGNAWIQQGSKLAPSTGASGSFGWSVALSSDGLTAIIGAPFHSGGLGGAAWVFVPIGGTWVQEGSVLTPNDASGETSLNFGYAVAMSADGNLAMVGGPWDDNAGAVWVFTRNNGTWSQSGSKLTSGDPGLSFSSPQFGSSIALSADGKTALIGEFNYEPASLTGAAWLFTQSNGTWAKQGGRLAPSDGSFSQFGTSVALSSDASTALIGGPRDGLGLGAVFVFVQTPTITAVAPGSGPGNGGTIVTITGTGFTGATAVKFGGIDAAAFTVLDPHTITATTPAHAGGTVDVSVTNAIGTGTLAAAFNYLFPTTITLISSSNPASFGEDVTFRATLSNASAPGTVMFMDGASILGTAPIQAGIARFRTSALAVGNHSITAVYAGTATFSGSTSSALAQTVGKGATRTALSATPDAAFSGQSATLKATVSVLAPASATVSGRVSFYDNGVLLRNAPVVNGRAQVNVVLSTGAHDITATYNGDAHLLGSSRNTTVTVTAMVGSETRVNRNATFAQLLPATARLKSGYVIAWVTDQQDGSGLGVLARRYSPTGIAGSEIAVTRTFGGDQTLPAAAGFADGSFVIVWQSTRQEAGAGIYAQRFSPTGVKVGSEFRINDTTLGDQTRPAVVALANNDFVVTWMSRGQDRSGQGIYARRFKAGSKTGDMELKVNTTIAGDQSNPSIAPLGAGFVVTWQSQDASGTGIFYQRFDANDKRLGAELQANTTAANDQSLPKVATLRNGRFVIAWQSVGQDGDGLGVFMQLFTAGGQRVGRLRRVATMTAGDQAAPSVSAFADSGFVVTWSAPDSDGMGIYVQAFNNAGVPIDNEIRVNTQVAGDQYEPSVAALGDGDFVTAWTGLDASGTGILAQRLKVPIQ
jgi:hypothetical protein